MEPLENIMSWVDNEFAERVFSVLPRFRKVTTSGQFKLNARCPICGDSQKDAFKARFWAYPVNDSLRVHCFNCDYADWFNVFLKEQEPDLYRDYLLEKRKEQVFDRPIETKTEISEKLTAKLIIEKLDYCERLDRLPEEHPIIKYVLARCIPKDKLKRLWFTNQWPALVNSVNPGTYKNETNEPRLVIPIFNKQGKIESFQGRALRKDAPQKYITIKAHESATKIYGLDTVDESKDVYVMEGPIDSLFVDNAIAITGGSLDLGSMPFKDKRVWVMDHEPRHPDTIKRMKRLIDSGERVVFWDKSPWGSKDVNDMIRKDGATASQIMSYIESNSASGLEAKMRFSKYAKV
ncbi:DNA primase [Erwinia phage Cronus]|uniref:DNA primase n=1 Tax=Erwinia phage Cronus TaxID=2163633 RepID=A0A2S1GM91_9CAUD|nr:DNA primase [Erwinia phage Cronus]AWD90463.1 DNA primase [Erwinia phage Cronus]